MTEVSAVRRAIFIERALSSTDCKGSNGSLCRAWKTTKRSQEGMRYGLRGFNLRTPLRNLIIRLCFPNDLSFTVS